MNYSIAKATSSLAIAASAALLGCSSSGGDGGAASGAAGQQPGAPAGAGAGAAGGAASAGGGATGAPGAGAPNPKDPAGAPAAACAASRIYVVGESQPTKRSHLYTFDPAAHTISDVGQIDCLDFGERPTTIAVDRTGVLWMFGPSQGTPRQTVTRVSTTDASCIGNSDLLVPAFTVAGSQFVADAAGNEKLMVSLAPFGQDTAPDLLGSYDAATSSLVDVRQLPAPVLQISDPAGYGGLTRDERGNLLFDRLQGLIAVNPVTANIVDIRAGSQAVTDRNTAKAFWGGALYYFDSSFGSPSGVTRFDLATGAAQPFMSVLNDVAIMFAATSGTCAPTAP